MMSSKTWAKLNSTYTAKGWFLLFEVFLIYVQVFVRWNVTTDSWGLLMINASSVISWSLLRRLWPQMTSSAHIWDILASLLCSGRKWRRPSFFLSVTLVRSHCQYKSLYLTEPRAWLETLRLVDKICEEVVLYPCAAMYRHTVRAHSSICVSSIFLPANPWHLQEAVQAFFVCLWEVNNRVWWTVEHGYHPLFNSWAECLFKWTGFQSLTCLMGVTRHKTHALF